MIIHHRTFHFGRVHRLLACLALAASLAHPCAFAADDDKAPASAAAGWASIDKNLQQLEALIHAGKIGELGSSAYGIANAFKAIASQSTMLSADQQAVVKKDVAVVGSEVSKLDKAGEHNDSAGVQSHLQALKSTLDGVRPFYAH
jgi:hypothetical protein